MSSIKITVNFFGSFRQFGESIEFTVPKGSNISTIKLEIQKKLNGEKLVMDSVLANDNAVLCDGDILSVDAKLSILPPVCGG